MTLSDDTRAAVLARLNEPREFLTYAGLRTPLPLLEGDSDELKAAVTTLNNLFFLIFPQVEANTRDEVFGPFRMLSADEFAVLEAVAPEITHPGLRARAHEQLWAYRPGKHDPLDAIRAAQAYLDHLATGPAAAENDHSNDAAATLERAARLSAQYARHPKGTDVYLRTQELALNNLRDAARPLNSRAWHLQLAADTLKPTERGATEQHLLTEMAHLDQELAAAGEHPWRRTLADLRVALTAKMDPAERERARLHGAHVREAEGDAIAATNPVAAKLAYMDAERKYVDLNMLVQALQMRHKGAALGPAIAAGMTTTEIDVSDFAQFSEGVAAREIHAADSLGAYLRALAAHPAVAPKPADAAASRPLHKLFGQLHFGRGGQVVNTSGQSGEPGFDLDEMQWHAQLSAILNTHLWTAADQHWAPSEHDLFPLVAASAAVPEHSRTLVTVGFLFALHGDAMVASSMLAPLPEAILRQTLEAKGELAPHTDPTRVQMSTTLGTLLDPQGTAYASLVQHFGPDLMLDVKRVLDTESLNVRNTMLHGLGGDHYAQDWPGRALIQLTFRLVFGAHPGLTVTTPPAEHQPLP